MRLSEWGELELAQLEIATPDHPVLLFQLRKRIEEEFGITVDLLDPLTVGEIEKKILGALAARRWRSGR